jgi:hypothetical protein
MWSKKVPRNMTSEKLHKNTIVDKERNNYYFILLLFLTETIKVLTIATISLVTTDT